jgi:hypothetical protein
VTTLEVTATPQPAVTVAIGGPELIFQDRRTIMATRKRSTGRRYGKAAGSKVKRAMHERKSGTLRSGRSGKKVTSRKQAIAIGLSEARREGGKVPKRSARRRTKK